MSTLMKVLDTDITSNSVFHNLHKLVCWDMGSEFNFTFRPGVCIVAGIAVAIVYGYTAHLLGGY